MTVDAIIVDDRGVARCWWCGDDDEYRRYHDEEWGVPVTDDRRLFEKLALEGFQCGLSWLTILRRRDGFRAAFHEFDLERVAAMGEADVERLVRDPGIIRHRGKIRSTIANAGRAIALVEEFGSLSAYLSGFAPDAAPPPPRRREDLPSVTDESTCLSRDLKRRGWSFVGPTTMYAMMQAVGIVNDHVADCHRRSPTEAARRAVVPPVIR
ncbi:MAG: DNA-3-methyladenine glycosylase I [Planctomycetota bacterium]|jgi:DNA-3-methyladenine glycosylase I